MVRKSEAELLDEINTLKRGVAENKAKKLKDYQVGMDEEEDVQDWEHVETPEIEPANNPQPQVVEREINLALINDKLDFIISILNPKQ